MQFSPSTLPDCHSHVFCLRSVCGFDHADLDAQQQDWHTHLYPYKLASYQKTLLSEPVTLGVLHYNTAIGASPADSRVDLGSGASASSALPIVQAGKCDAVVIWVDYELTDSHSLCAWDGRDFPIYLTVNVKFFAAPQQVQPGQSVLGSVRLDHSKADFELDFELEN